MAGYELCISSTSSQPRVNEIHTNVFTAMDYIESFVASCHIAHININNNIMKYCSVWARLHNEEIHNQT